jgi:predicted TIM-barrel fold metal-dependent hydrolase
MLFTYSFTLFVASSFYSLVSSAPTTTLQSNSSLPPKNNSLPPLITLEEHFIAHAIANSSWNAERVPNWPLPGDELELPYYTPDQLSRALDVGSGRVQDLDAAGIVIQVISQIPTTHVPPANLCIAANTELAAATHAHPDRLAGFALLPMLDPVVAATELQRAVRDLGFLGTLIPNHANERYYDDSFFWPIFEMAQELDVPVYLHPSYVADDQFQHFTGNYSQIMSLVLATYGYGW